MNLFLNVRANNGTEGVRAEGVFIVDISQTVSVLAKRLQYPIPTVTP